MVLQSHGDLFEKCKPALHRVARLGPEKARPEDLQILSEAREILTNFVCSMLRGKESERMVSAVRVILQSTHPDRNYEYMEAIARDTLDVCVTMSRILTGKTRSAPTKTLELVMYLDELRDATRAYADQG